VPSRTPVAGASCWTAAFTKISPDPTILPSSVLSKRVDDATVTKAAHTTRLSDFNRDGFTDLVVRDAAGKDAKLWLYPGDGTGGVAARTPISSGWPPVTALATPGNLDGAGGNDLVARDAEGRLWLYPGDNSGGFGAPRQIPGEWKDMTYIG
jgi:FG-GAP-like repeat